MDPRYCQLWYPEESGQQKCTEMGVGGLLDGGDEAGMYRFGVRGQKCYENGARWLLDGALL